MINFIKRITRGFSSTPLLFITSLLTIDRLFTVWNDCLSELYKFSPQLSVSISCVIALLIVKLPHHLKKKIAGTNTQVEIIFGDIFESKDGAVIPFNNFYDTKLGEIVSENSLHGKYIRKFFLSDDKREELNKTLQEKLADIDSQVNDLKSRGSNKEYPIGTCVKTRQGEQDFYLLAFAKTDPRTLKATADINILLKSLEGLWDHLKTRGEGKNIGIPLIGGGISTLNLKSEDLLILILISYKEHIKKEHIEPITFYINKDLENEINLDNIKRILS